MYPVRESYAKALEDLAKANGAETFDEMVKSNKKEDAKIKIMSIHKMDKAA